MSQPASQFLPLFPLEMVAFPGEAVKLHIFEPRYKQLIGECRDTGMTFGIPAYIDGKVAEYGTEMTLVEVYAVHPNGEMDILTRGMRRFRLSHFRRDVPDKLYSGGDVEFFDDEPDPGPTLQEELAREHAKLFELLDVKQEPPDFGGPTPSFRLAQQVGMNVGQKLMLLALPRESARQALLLEHLRRVVPMVEAAREIKRRVGGNGHFRKFPKIEL